MNDTKWFITSFNRSNLQYEVRPKKGKSVLKDIIDLIKQNWPKKSGIVYCFSRKECEDVASQLQQNQIHAVAYHAGLGDKQRTSAQEQWIKDKVHVVCATIAFGMGIDKPDVRFVIHFSLPKSMEGYYQESGRAGRDGRKSTCILFWQYGDKHRVQKLIELDTKASQEVRQIHYNNLWEMVNYCENTHDCRRVLQVRHHKHTIWHTVYMKVFSFELSLLYSYNTWGKCLIQKIANLMVLHVTIAVRVSKNWETFLKLQ